VNTGHAFVLGVGVVVLPFFGGYSLGGGGWTEPSNPSLLAEAPTLETGPPSPGQSPQTGILGERSADAPLDHTFSIVAVDQETGEVGVAVTTRNACVGNRVPWVRAGVGAVATQAATRPEYGQELLDSMEKGLTPEAALRDAVSRDEGAGRRQVGVVAISGSTAQHTGTGASSWAGERNGPGFATQGNILTGPEVLNEVARVMEETASSGRALADRLIAALEAGHAAGGDKRKGRRQSAAVIIADPRAGRTTRPDGQSVFLNVCEHPEPVTELRRQFEAVSQTLGYRAFEVFSGSDVWQLKVILHALGFFRPEEATLARGPDSERFTSEVAEAVDRFREARGLSTPSNGSPSGLVDQTTVFHLWEALEEGGKAVETRKLLRDATAIRN